jgi:type II secretory pathway pseudopilin PulG
MTRNCDWNPGATRKNHWIGLWSARIHYQGSTSAFVFDGWVGAGDTKEAVKNVVSVFVQMNTNSLTERRNSESAFTLVEVTIASAISGISCISLVLALSTGFSTVQATRENLRATQIMVQKMETLRLYNWTELTQATNYVVPNFSEYFNPASRNGVLYVGQITVDAPTNLPSNLAYSNQIVSVTVSVCWTNYVNGQPFVHNRNMQTYAALYGIQNYVYY